ncbi:MAG: glutathione S-transferase N-terminal domain-containing protein [Myxococcales bacterium]|nr:glutathione S-transferase N-terminal domain-containing protein [Myxococcales bacterium]
MSTYSTVSSWVVSVSRLGRGYVATLGGSQPRQPIEIFEFEGCPFCRKVREVVSELDLEYVCRPCFKGSNNRQRAIEVGGKTLFPLLVDHDAGEVMYESEDIISYLTDRYGPKHRSGLSRTVAPLNTAGAMLASALRPTRGSRVRPECADREQPAELLELWSFEASPYCRKVRERLGELNLDYLVHNVAKKSARRPQLVALGGKMQVPYLVDPNTQTALYESEDINAYLTETYG